VFLAGIFVVPLPLQQQGIDPGFFKGPVPRLLLGSFGRMSFFPPLTLPLPPPPGLFSTKPHDWPLLTLALGPEVLRFLLFFFWVFPDWKWGDYILSTLLLFQRSFFSHQIWGGVFGAIPGIAEGDFFSAPPISPGAGLIFVR